MTTFELTFELLRTPSNYCFAHTPHTPLSVRSAHTGFEPRANFGTLGVER
ncbi:hypothetical protein EV667_1987 [Ancylobacter aquaticus]|uniref:Uncharacterized protein n=1 Tax=Ancylobacter aquaticus TaxID=100 RepID=A0A4R1I224_ANCAQ|nr:hypothetical protein EV667_1987 [Ancylobacter aquaticus]